MSDEAEFIKTIAHEVNSKAISLKGAVALFQKAPPAERDELLALMAKHAQYLADFLKQSRTNGNQP